MRPMKLSLIPDNALRGIRKIKIQHRLFMIFLVISLFPILGIGLFSYNIYTHSIHTKLSESYEQAIQLLNTNLITQIGKFQDYCNLLSVADVLQAILSVPPTELYTPNLEQVVDLKNLIVEIPFQSKYLKSVRIIDRNRNLHYDLGYDDIPAEKYEEILNEIDQTSPLDSLQYIKTYRAYDKIVLGRKLFNQYGTNEHIGYLLIFIDEKLFSEEIFSNVSFGKGSNILFIDGMGNVISSQNRNMLGQNLTSTEFFQTITTYNSQKISSFTTDIDGAKHLVVYNYNPTYKNYLVATIPYTYITQETSLITSSLVFFALILFLICVVSTCIVYISIVKPIRHMIAFCNAAKEHDLDQRINDSSSDELGFLSRTIDQMLGEIKTFTINYQNDQQRKRQLELEMLQYQINPHFLFNTLNTLKWIAIINDVPTLSEGIASLSSLLESTLVKKDALITIQEEITNLSHYFSIQKIRYGDSFDVVYDLDEALLDYEIPRFILQPLAENAILHGHTDSIQTLIIRIQCCCDREDNLTIKVIDNGKGFDASTLYEAKGERFTGLGISNVNERIHLHYGKDYGLTISSIPGEGTCCCIVLPKRLMKEDKND